MTNAASHRIAADHGVAADIATARDMRTAPRPFRDPEEAARLAADLNRRFKGASAEEILHAVFREKVAGEAALVSSFGADSAALLHVLSTVAPEAPVLLLDTEMLFVETLEYQQELGALLGLTGIRRIRPDEAELTAEDRMGDLHQSDQDACCDLRKVRPLARALAPFGAAVSGRKRHQSATRAALEVFEADADGRLRINPLADWTSEMVRERIREAGLPPHPLVAKGFLSIGCAPCTTAVRPGEDPRAGRWRGAAKTECGIHVIDGKTARPRAA